jgi:hypothetical protein
LFGALEIRWRKALFGQGDAPACQEQHDPEGNDKS